MLYITLEVHNACYKTYILDWNQCAILCYCCIFDKWRSLLKVSTCLVNVVFIAKPYLQETPLDTSIDDISFKPCSYSTNNIDILQNFSWSFHSHQYHFPPFSHSGAITIQRSPKPTFMKHLWLLQMMINPSIVACYPQTNNISCRVSHVLSIKLRLPHDS